MLSQAEAAAAQRGQLLKRYVRAAAAMQGIYDDVTLGEAVGVQRGAVLGWWRGSRPSPMTLRDLADATGLAVDELAAFVYYDGVPPRLPGIGE
jgi:transcriptional regulator with XRE-family HTH domain